MLFEGQGLQVSLPLEHQANNLPEYQREFVDWLDGFHKTAELRRVCGTQHFTAEEIDRMKARLKHILVPKVPPAGHHRQPRTTRRKRALYPPENAGGNAPGFGTF